MTSVGYKLYREFLDFGPRKLPKAALAVALVIADDARDETRRSGIALELLCWRARLSERGVRDALQALAGTGYEFRIPVTYDKHGQPVFATKGHAVDYLVPDVFTGGTSLPPSPGDNHAIGGTCLPPMASQRRQGPVPKAAGSGPKGGRDVPPLSSGSPHYPSAEALDLDASPVESARAAPGHDHRHHHQPGRPLHWVSPIEQAARQAAEARHIRTGGTT